MPDQPEQRGKVAQRYALNRCAGMLATALDEGCDLMLPNGEDHDHDIDDAYDAVVGEIEKIIKSLAARAGREVTADELIQSFRNLD